MIIKEGLSYDDVLLEPTYSEIGSRSEVDLSVTIFKTDSNIFKFTNPLISANMSTVTAYDMAETFFKMGAMAIVHRFMSIEDQVDLATTLQRRNVGNPMNFVGFSIGVQESDKLHAQQLVDAGVRIICIDVAHGDSKLSVDMCRYISGTYPDILLIAGNVATAPGAVRLWEAGADIVKAGVGPGSLCSTRIETGNGVPQLTALMDIALFRGEAQRRLGRPLYFIADGGIKNSGDATKALALADMVMVGSLLAGTDEAPGEEMDIDGQKYKRYDGSSTLKTNHIEGVTALIPSRGPVRTVITKLLQGISSGCSYQGSYNLTELKDNPVFIKITNAGLAESRPHNSHTIK